MNSKDYRNLQEAYIGVYDDDIREKLEFESWVNNLLEEGYDLSDYTWDELYENYSQLDEAITSEKGKAKAAEMIAARSTPSGRAKSGQGATVAQIKHIGRSNREGLSGTPMTPTMAKNPVKSASYGGTGNKAARRAGTYSRFGYKESYELYDIILSHLIDEGYADTQEAAERIMVNMSEDWRESIVETRMDPRGRPASGTMNVYANSKGKPSQAHLDAVKSYDAEQKKKTPEQRKKELDDYRERQMNNK